MLLKVTSLESTTPHIAKYRRAREKQFRLSGQLSVRAKLQITLVLEGERCREAQFRADKGDELPVECEQVWGGHVGPARDC